MVPTFLLIVMHTEKNIDKNSELSVSRYILKTTGNKIKNIPRCNKFEKINKKIKQSAKEL